MLGLVYGCAFVHFPTRVSPTFSSTGERTFAAGGLHYLYFFAATILECIKPKFGNETALRVRSRRQERGLGRTPLPQTLPPPASRRGSPPLRSAPRLDPRAARCICSSESNQQRRTLLFNPQISTPRLSSFLGNLAITTLRRYAMKKSALECTRARAHTHTFHPGEMKTPASLG